MKLILALTTLFAVIFVLNGQILQVKAPQRLPSQVEPSANGGSLQNMISSQIQGAMQGPVSNIEKQKQNIEKDIQDLDQNKFTKTVKLNYNGRVIKYNGKEFVYDRTGEQLSPEESQKAKQALRKGLQKTLQNLTNTQQRLQNVG
ncbi:unnamed protein product [Brachionus calyciflorus]|uniref:Uncharacterized protein n=1 Tax=Brachionus calyciflorus TaxID=104777 RepID=A0A814KXX6_9BILA|nr:unnamed protein product [Brachionus calyciflorus]